MDETLSKLFESSQSLKPVDTGLKGIVMKTSNWNWAVTEIAILLIFIFIAAIYLRLQARKKRSVEDQLSIANEELQKKQEFCDSIFENTRECIKVLDLDCKLNFMNSGGQKLLEICDFAPLKGANWLEFWNGKDKESAQTAIETARLGGVGQFTGYFPTVQTRTPKWFEVVITAMRDQQGLPSGLLVVSRDVTSRRDVEEVIRKSGLELKSLAESIPQIVWTSGPDGNLDYYNQRWFDYTGMTLEQTKGWGWEPVLHPDDLQNCISKWSHAINTGDPYEVEYRFKRARDGAYRWHLGRAIPIRDSNDLIVKWFGTCTDIHEQKEISEERISHAAHELLNIEVKRSKEFLDRIIDNLPSMVFIKDAKELKYVRVNKAVQEFLGCTEADFIGKSDYDFFQKEQADLYHANDRTVLASEGKIEIREVQIQNVNGMRNLRSKIMALTGADGIQYLLGISEDVTDQKNSEEAIIKLNNELELKVLERTQELLIIAETIPHLVWIIAGDGKSLYFNKRWTDYTGTSLDKPSSSWEDIIHLEDIPLSKLAWENSIKTGDAYSVEYRIRRTDGEFRWHLTRALPIVDANSKVVKWFGTCTDIHDQKEVERVARESAARTDAIISNANIILWSTDTKGICTYSEGNGLALMGTKPGQRVGQSIYDYVKNQPDFFDVYRAALNGVKGQARINFGEYSFEAIVTPVKDESGHVVGVVGATFDTTKRVRAELDLCDAKAHLESVIKHAPIVLWSVDKNGKYTLAQGKGLASAGLKSEDMVGQSVFDLYRDRPEVISSLKSCFEGNSFEVESTVNGASFSTQFAPIKNVENQVTGLVGLSIDITEAKMSKENLQREKDRLQRVVSASVISVAFSNREGNVVDANDAFLELTGYSKTDLTEGKIKRQVQDPDELTGESRRGLEAFLKEGKCSPYEKLLTRKDGREVPILIGFSDLGNDRNDIVTWMMNLTELKHAEQQKSLLEVREKAALESTKMKSEFLANMSHEIRTPINGVIGMTSLLLDTQLNDEQRDYGETIRSSADTLLTLVNDILDLSKAEAGKIDLEIINFDMGEVVLDIERTVGFAANRKGLKLLKSVPTDLPAYLKGDPTRLRQVLANLVNNAIKFTPQGSVTIEIYTEVRSVDQIRLRFEVADTGIGIPQEALSRMFQAFSQADASTTRKFGGTGLGLSICKQLVKLMGGEIGVKSNSGTGSIFWFTIPFEIGDHLLGEFSSTDDAILGVQRKLRILVAEDNSVNQLIAIRMLEKLGHTAVAVANGIEAIDALRATPYDLVFMDCQMPELDGYEATKMIRTAKTLECSNIPIIAMTANAMSGDREKCLEAGMTDYLSKPMKSKDLALAIDRNIKGISKAA